MPLPAYFCRDANHFHCVKSVQTRSYFWSVFGHFSLSVQIRQKSDSGSTTILKQHNEYKFFPNMWKPFKIFISKYLINYFQDTCVITVGSVEAEGSFCGKRIHNWLRSIKSIKEVYFNCYAMQSHVILTLLTYIHNCI